MKIRERKAQPQNKGKTEISAEGDSTHSEILAIDAHLRKYGSEERREALLWELHSTFAALEEGAGEIGAKVNLHELRKVLRTEAMICYVGKRLQSKARSKGDVLKTFIANVAANVVAALAVPIVLLPLFLLIRPYAQPLLKSLLE